MKKYLFVGEKRSPTAIKMGVTWKDKRLCASHLSKALDNIGINWGDCDFMNVFEDDIEKIRKHKGFCIAMGRKVERVLKKENIKHEFIYHPATRGKIRNIEKYKNHVENQIKHII